MEKDLVLVEAGDISEATFDLESKVIRNAILIKAGTSKNKRTYSAEVLRRDGPSVFEGANSYSGHVETFHERTDPRNLMGSIKDVRFDEASQSLRGDIYYFEGAVDTITKAKLAHDMGNKDLIGLSIQTPGKQEVVRQSGRLAYDVQSLLRDPTTSVDMVVGPAAGGRMFEAEILEDVMNLDELKKMVLATCKESDENFRKKITEAQSAEEVITLAAARKGGKEELESEKPSVPNPDTQTVNHIKESDVAAMIEARVAKIEAQHKLKEMVLEANLPKEMADKVVEKFQDNPGDVKAVESDINFFKELVAKMAPKAEGEKITIGAESEDKLQAAMDGMFGVVSEAKDVKPFKGIKEAYIAMTGDVDVTGHSKVRLTEAFNTANFAFILGTSMYRRMIQDYTEADWEWQKFCSIGSAPDFKTQERVRVGYLADLPAMFDTEAVDYLETDYYADEEATFDIKQTGRLLTVTRKMIINDDLNTISKVTGRLGRAASRTLARRVYVTRLAGNTAYTPDTSGTGLFFSSNRTCVPNRNLGSTALTIAGVTATISLMEKFVEPTVSTAATGDPIGFQARPGELLLIVPPDLRWTAYYINQKELIDGTEAHHNPMRGFFGANNEDIIVSPLLTDTTDWYLAWKPTQVDWIEVDFLQGRQEPELFLQDNPTVGDVFTRDKITYKVRHEYEVVFLDCRGCYKHVVAGA